MFKRLFRFIGQARSPKMSGYSSHTVPAHEKEKSTIEEDEVISSNPGLEQTSPKKAITIDSNTGEVVQEIPQDINTEYQSLSPVAKQLPPNLPHDIVRLAAQNNAFFQGILAIKKLNLDEDLFLEAIEDLRRKYYKDRPASRV